MASEKRKRVAWHEERHVRARDLPSGPQNAKELGDWPLWIARSLCVDSPGGKEVELRLQTHFSSGINMYTDYSGIDCPRESLRLGLAGLTKLLGWSFPACVCHSRSSDKDPSCRAVLQHLAQEDNGCVFGDILDRLPDWARSWIDAALPSSGATCEQKKEAHRAIVDWVANHADQLFTDDATSWCYAHDCKCPSHPVLARDTFKRFPRPLMVTCAGVSCLPWSAEGSQEAEASTCEVPHGVWIWERKVRAEKYQEDIAFLECTPRYPIESGFQDNLEGSHFCIWVRVGPELLGWPHKRMRVLGAALNLKTVDWHGPPDQRAIAIDFASRFHRATVASGDVFALASESERQQEYIGLAKKQKNHLKPAHLDSIPKKELLRLLLPPGAVQRFNEWMDTASDGCSLGGRYMFDVDHHPNTKGSTGGSDWPVNLRHGTVLSVDSEDADSWKIMTTMEHFASMGFLVFPELQETFSGWSGAQFLTDSSRFQLKRFLGNGMHLVTQAAWMFYVLGHTSLKDPRHEASGSDFDATACRQV